MNSAGTLLFGIAFIMLNLMELCSGTGNAADYINFCDPQLCPKDKKHIRCNRQWGFGSACSKDVKIQLMTDAVKSTILHKHNSYRNDIAGGQLYKKKFLPAGQMAVMQWDWDLANNALYHVMQCEMTHDECRSTPKFKNAGQNIASIAWSGGNPTVADIASRQIDSLFSEWQNTTMKEINNFNTPYSGAVIGHFTQIVQDKSHKIGCHIIRHTTNGWTQQLMTCDYAYGNMLNASVYQTAAPGSMCKTGTDSTYRNLCNARETYVV